MFKVLKYRRPDGEVPFDLFVLEVRAEGKRGLVKVQRVIDALRERGFELLTILLLKKIEDDIYELRPQPYRVLVYWSDSHQAFFLLNGFRKRSQKLPRAELDQARRLRDELLMEGP